MVARNTTSDVEYALEALEEVINSMAGWEVDPENYEQKLYDIDVQALKKTFKEAKDNYDVLISDLKELID